MVRKKLDQKYFLSAKNSAVQGLPASSLQPGKKKADQAKSKDTISHAEIFQKLQKMFEPI